jgi:uroporphyrinogen-III synthase
MERIVITAAAGSFAGLADALKSPDSVVAEQPLIHFRPPADWEPFDRALDRLDYYRAVALTSPRAAVAMSTRLLHRGIRWPAANGPTTWAGGAATAAALGSTFGVVRTPEQRQVGLNGAAAALAGIMIDEGVAGPVLFPCGSIRRELLPETLRRRGITVDEVVCYQSVLADESHAQAAAAAATVLIVASPAVVQLLARAVPAGARPDLVTVGPTSSDAARNEHWEPAGVAVHPTAEAVAFAVRQVLARRSVP